MLKELVREKLVQAAVRFCPTPLAIMPSNCVRTSQNGLKLHHQVYASINTRIVSTLLTFKEPADTFASASMKVCRIALSEKALPKSSAS